jgi:hypothetical protein
MVANHSLPQLKNRIQNELRVQETSPDYAGCNFGEGRDGSQADLRLGAAIYSGHSDGFDQEVKRGLAPSSPSRRQGKFFAALLPLK